MSEPLRLLALPRLTPRVWRVWQRNRDVFLKTYRVNFLPPFLEPLLYLLSLGFGVGSFIPEIAGVSYPRFIAPALVSITIMNAGFFECTYASYVRMYYQKTYDAIIATPLSIDEVIVGEILWGATRALINTTIMLPVLFVFGVIDLPWALLVIPFAFVAGLLFATIGMCFTAVTPGIDTLNLPTFLFITPMFLFSGTFFPLSLLPAPVQYLAVGILPLTHVVTVIRSLTLGAPAPLLPFSLLWLCVATVLVFLLSVNLMRQRLVV
ncbi:MAG: ABC transporter permease [Methanomicrobiales archaeon]|nr:ABC transporter permease [Methanomicrobiales archaeon]